MKDDSGQGGGSREEREAEEKRLDEAIEESFPASDPLPTTGTSAGAPVDRPAQPPPESPSQKKPDRGQAALKARAVRPAAPRLANPGRRGAGAARP